jgi:hypothetical protein
MKYLLQISEDSARHLEQWLAGPLHIGTDVCTAVPVDSLAAVTDDEIQPILERLATSGPIYHFGGASS